MILDLGPASKGHALVLPKEHYDNITEMPEQAIGEAFSLAGKVGKAMQRGLGAAGLTLFRTTARRPVRRYFTSTSTLSRATRTARRWLRGPRVRQSRRN